MGETTGRAARLVWHGARDGRHMVGIPARDLDEGDIAALTDEQYERATGGADPLYREPKADGKPRPAATGE